jgi:hypothetical protein
MWFLPLLGEQPVEDTSLLSGDITIQIVGDGNLTVPGEAAALAGNIDIQIVTAGVLFSESLIGIVPIEIVVGVTANIVPVEIVGAGGPGIVPCRQFASGVGVVKVRQAPTEVPRVKIVLV